MTYQLIYDPIDDTIPVGILDTEKKMCIPLDPSNKDYQEYLKRVENQETEDLGV